MIGVEVLHVLDLGLTRMLVHSCVCIRMCARPQGVSLPAVARRVFASSLTGGLIRWVGAARRAFKHQGMFGALCFLSQSSSCHA